MKSKNERFSSSDIALQSWLRPALTPVSRNCDFERFREDLERIERNLRTSAVEAQAIDMALENLGEKASAGSRRRRARFAVYALRAEILRHLLGLPSFRAFSRMLAGSDLLADFCGIRTLEGIKGSSKSTLERASKRFDEEQLRALHCTLAEVAANGDLCGQVGLAEPVDATVCLVDTTCLEADIHFPTDWVLLRDVAMTLLKAVKLIRREGLRVRMPERPEALAWGLNRLCIRMTHSRRRKDGRKERKAVLREMKQELKRIGGHARRHRDLLESKHGATRWSEAQARRVWERIDEKLEQLPEVIRQAHERIIGGRQVPSAEKILSVHDEHVQVIVRGKAGREVEFGNKLFISEGSGGFVFDYRLYGDRVPGDAETLLESLERQNAMDIEQPLENAVGDRGFDTRRVNARLEREGIRSSVCPKDPEVLRERLNEPVFASWQKRRGSTEARIAIVTHNGGRRCRAKGFANRARAVGWGVLAHNLLWIARALRAQEKKNKAAA